MPSAAPDPIRLSSRARAIAPFLAMAFGQRAAELEAQGHRVIKLNLGEPDFGAPQAVREALADLARHAPLPYTGALGLPALREAIAAFYRQRHGVVVAPQRIVVTAGASAALLLAAAALVEPGDRVIVGDPSYPCNRQFLATFGADVALVPTTAATRFQLDVATVQAHWTPTTRGLMVATPSNPTGTTVPPDELAALCAWVRAQGGWRIVDEIYLELADAAPGGAPPPTVLAADPDAIVVNSFSKYWGMTGWRLGWCVVPEAMVGAMERLAQNLYICAATPAQQAALACFTPPTLAECEARRTEFAARRTLVADGLAHMGLSVPVRPDGAFYVYADISATGLDAMAFCHRALEEAHVALTPGDDFGHHQAGRHVRLSCSASQADLQEGLTRLARFLAHLG